MENNPVTNQVPSASVQSPTSLPQQAPTVPKNSSTTMWDAFEHILMFISLYVMATSIVLVLYYFIDKWFPGVTQDRYSYSNNDWQLGVLRGYLAALIVSYPLFAFFFINTIKRTISNPLLRTIKTRKVLIYFTLIVTFIIMLIYVIQLVYKLLSGDVTVNFILHLLALFSVTGIIFVYYILQVKGDRKIND